MDFDETPEEAAWRAECREFLSAHAQRKDPSTLRTLEGYAAAHYVAGRWHGAQVGPLLVAGQIRELRAQEGRGFEPGAVAGAGLRLALDGSELHVLAAWTSILPGHKDGTPALVAALHLRLKGGTYWVADAIVGPTWVLRSGVAVKAF